MAIYTEYIGSEAHAFLLERPWNNDTTVSSSVRKFVWKHQFINFFIKP